MNGQMLCKQEFYMLSVCMQQMLHVYHRVCSINFRTMKPMAYEREASGSKTVKLDRLQEKQRANTFFEVAKYLEEK